MLVTISNSISYSAIVLCSGDDEGVGVWAWPTIKYRPKIYNLIHLAKVSQILIFGERCEHDNLVVIVFG